MTRAASIIGSLVVATTAALPGAAAERALAPAHASIVEATSVQLNWAVAMPSVRGNPQGANFQGTMPAIGLGMMMPGNARLTVRREDDSGEPVTAPTNFEVVTTEGDEALILRTGGSSTFGARLDGAFVGGSILGGAAASIDVARGGGVFRIADAPATTATLVVLVQYN